MALFLLLTIFRFYAQAAAPPGLPAQPQAEVSPISDVVLPQISVPGQDEREQQPLALATAVSVEAQEAVSQIVKDSPSILTPLPADRAVEVFPPDVPTRLEIPELKLDVQVRFAPFQENTWDLSDLGQDVAWLGSIDGHPLDKGLVLAGHITVRNGDHGPFRFLGRLQRGALIHLHTERQTYAYRVTERFVVEPEDSDFIARRPKSQLTLITCVTWDEATKSYLNRQIVVAQLISPESRTEALSD